MCIRDRYNFDRFTEMELQPTAPHEPYTLGGIITKIIDTAISEEEGIRDPDVMSSWWKHSGIRIYWSYHVRGRVVRPLLVKLAEEIERYESGQQTDSSVLSEELVTGLRSLLSFSITSSDNYAVQNLAIIAHEYTLSCAEREQLIAAFFDEQIDQAQFQSEIIESLLVEQRLKSSIRNGFVPAECYVALYTKSPVAQPRPDADTFIQYRAAALQRARIAKRLSLVPATGTEFGSDLTEVVSLYDLRKVA